MATKALTSNFSGVLKFFESHVTTFLNVVTTVFTVLAQGLVSENLFSCPCLRYEEASLDRYLAQTASRWNAAYSLVFMLLPVIVLFCISLAVNNETNRCLAMERYHCNIRRHFRAFRYLVTKSSSALVAPAAWLFVVFLDGRYLECAMGDLPTICLPTKSVTTNATVLNILADKRSTNQYYHSLSQVIAVAALGFIIVVVTASVLCTRLCNRTTYYQQEFMTKLRTTELQLFHDTADKILKKDVAKTWEDFFHTASEGDWRAISQLPYSEPDVINGKFYYSALHKWQAKKEAEANEADVFAEKGEEDSEHVPLSVMS